MRGSVPAAQDLRGAQDSDLRPSAFALPYPKMPKQKAGGEGDGEGAAGERPEPEKRAPGMACPTLSVAWTIAATEGKQPVLGGGFWVPTKNHARRGHKGFRVGHGRNYIRGRIRCFRLRITAYAMPEMD